MGLLRTGFWSALRTERSPGHPCPPLVLLNKAPSLPKGETVSHQGRKEIEERDILEKLTIANC